MDEERKGKKKGKKGRDEEEEEEYHGKGKKTKKGAAQEAAKAEESKVQEVTHRWVNLTSVFTHEEFGKKMLVHQIVFGSKHIFAICTHSPTSQQDSGVLVKKNKYVKGESKFPGAQIVIKKFVYLSGKHFHKNYTVCYMDRMRGLVESEVKKFYIGSDIPLHRVWQFKVDGEVVWDRKKKFTSIY